MAFPSTVLLLTQSDARLVALARTGHDRAFEAIVERYRRPLLRACLRILPEARAEDALQQALVAAWTALRRGDEVDELRPWLYRIARNTALNQLRIAGYDLEELVDTLGAASDPEEEVARRAVVRQTLAAVAALPERQRDALLRTAVHGHGQDEVARDLGLTDTAVRQLVHRARVAVRATATAAVPLPAAAWFASAGARVEPMAGRIADLLTGAGAGATVTLAKAGTAAVLAGGAVGAPSIVSDPSAAHRTTRERPAATATATPTPREAAVAAAPRRVTAPVVRPALGRHAGRGPAKRVKAARLRPPHPPRHHERHSGKRRDDAGDRRHSAPPKREHRAKHAPPPPPPKRKHRAKHAPAPHGHD